MISNNQRGEIRLATANVSFVPSHPALGLLCAGRKLSRGGRKEQEMVPIKAVDRSIFLSFLNEIPEVYPIGLKEQVFQ